MQECGDVRKELEQEGYRLRDEEYQSLLEYSRRKIAVAGKDESYLPLLLPDVIKEYFFMAYVNSVTILAM